MNKRALLILDLRVQEKPISKPRKDLEFLGQEGLSSTFVLGSRY